MIHTTDAMLQPGRTLLFARVRCDLCGIGTNPSICVTPELLEEMSDPLRRLARDQHRWQMSTDGKDICLDCQRP